MVHAVIDMKIRIDSAYPYPKLCKIDDQEVKWVMEPVDFFWLQDDGYLC